VSHQNGAPDRKLVINMAEAMDVDAGPGPSGRAHAGEGASSKAYDLPWVRGSRLAAPLAQHVAWL